ncbi:hypothetical protein GA0070563_10429 [Micromonospora carbonacea]|uniref:Uncharacterized protein n=1 Tax=Micromonospora carbonacea TaxID=47853 RepID=A0A1C4WUA7_9ACTN|nr:hypothetical protein GA0070563_10429 [Micromonospora carbonacea]
MTVPPPRALAADHRAPRAHDLTGLHPGDGCATRAADLADAVPVPQVTWTSAQHTAADVPERHRHA